MFQSTHSLRSATATGRESVIVSASFNPRTPCGVRLGCGFLNFLRLLFQSTHSLRSATYCPLLTSGVLKVSIHALLAECDLALARLSDVGIRFNPRTPCGVRLRTPQIFRRSAVFQSTHSLRSATRSGSRPCCGAGCFNPRTPCGVRLVSAVFPGAPAVSIHALLAECDNKGDSVTLWLYVSIHALLAECDASF